MAFAWQRADGERLLVAVNYAGNQSQCYVRLAFGDMAAPGAADGHDGGGDTYDRDGDDVVSRGLYLDLPPWGYHVFALTAS